MLTLYKELHGSENKHYITYHSLHYTFLSAREDCRCLGLLHSHWRYMAYISNLYALCYFVFHGTQSLSSIISTKLAPVKTHPSFCAVGSEGKSHRAQSQQGVDSSILFHLPLLAANLPFAQLQNS